MADKPTVTCGCWYGSVDGDVRLVHECPSHKHLRETNNALVERNRNLHAAKEDAIQQLTAAEARATQAERELTDLREGLYSALGGVSPSDAELIEVARLGRAARVEVEALSRSLNQIQDERAESFERLDKAVGGTGLTPYQPEIDILIEQRIIALRHDTGRERAARLEAEATTAALQALLMRVARVMAPPDNGDWACAECKPHSDMLQPGFRCAYHDVQAWRAAQAAALPPQAERKVEVFGPITEEQSGDSRAEKFYPKGCDHDYYERHEGQWACRQCGATYGTGPWRGEDY